LTHTTVGECLHELLSEFSRDGRCSTQAKFDVAEIKVLYGGMLADQHHLRWNDQEMRDSMSNNGLQKFHEREPFYDDQRQPRK
jgi:hypothetical protein